MIRVVCMLAFNALVLSAVTGCCCSVYAGSCCPAVPVSSAGTGWDAEAAASAIKLEVTVDRGGRPQETEFHVDPATVPEAVRAAMDAKHPGGAYIGAEKEWNDGILYYELAREVGGYEVEAMFRPDGTLFEEEIQIPTDDVPEAVRAAVAKGWPAGSVKAWEMIRNASGAITEYHVKLADEARALKIVVSTSGRLVRGYREVPAEIEVPISLPK